MNTARLNKLADPYNAFNSINSRTAKPATLGIPSTTVSGQTTAGGILIRDGTNLNMTRTPDFEQILDDMSKNKKQIKLPERTTFLGATMGATAELLSQPGVFGGQGSTGFRGMRGGGRDGRNGRDGRDGPERPAAWKERAFTKLLAFSVKKGISSWGGAWKLLKP
jgi:hypothetical protein